MKNRALLIATAAAATLGFVSFAQALTPAQSGALMDRDGGHSGKMHPTHITHAPRVGRSVGFFYGPHHYHPYYRHYRY
jgi:hypothetical protein